MFTCVLQLKKRTMLYLQLSLTSANMTFISDFFIRKIIILSLLNYTYCFVKMCDNVIKTESFMNASYYMCVRAITEV